MGSTLGRQCWEAFIVEIIVIDAVYECFFSNIITVRDITDMYDFDKMVMI